MKLRFAVILFITTMCGQGQQVVSHSDPSPGTTIWRIDQPIVTAHETTYPEIQFKSGDRVVVQAGGCVNTGGSGKTTKRYVDPTGDDSDRLYHGLILIPTVTAGLQRIQGFINDPDHSHVVQSFPEGVDPQLTILHLGYEDQPSDYGDNKYTDLDEGNGGQCKELGPAFVILTITHARAGEPPPAPVGPKAPMDLWWRDSDINLLPLNPIWGKQYTSLGSIPDAATLCNWFHNEGDYLNLGSPPCTTQHPAVDEPNGFSQPAFWAACQLDRVFPIGHPGHPAGTVHGHVNWGVATYTGTLYFEDWQVPMGGVDMNLGDNDYDFALVRSDRAGVTEGNRFRYQGQGDNGLTVEFNADETVENFDTEWWAALRAAVKAHPAHTGDWTAAQALVDGREAIVTGQIGIDTQHYPHTEIHPVYGLAIHTATAACEQTWQIFVRNWGNEGGCSQDQHYLPAPNVLSFRIPKPEGATALNVVSEKTTFHTNKDSISWGKKNVSTGVIVSFKLPIPQDRGIVHGQLQLAAEPCNAAVMSAADAMPASSETKDSSLSLHRPKFGVSTAEEREEGNLAMFTDHMTADQKAKFSAELLALNLSKKTTLKPTLIAAKQDDTIVPQQEPTVMAPSDPKILTRTEAILDSSQAESRRLQTEAIKSALGGAAATQLFLNRFLDKPELLLVAPVISVKVTVESVVLADSAASDFVRASFQLQADGKDVADIPLNRYQYKITEYPEITATAVDVDRQTDLKLRVRMVDDRGRVSDGQSLTLNWSDVESGQQQFRLPVSDGRVRFLVKGTVTVVSPIDVR